jgi:hypothetical protein
MGVISKNRVHPLQMKIGFPIADINGLADENPDGLCIQNTKWCPKCKTHVELEDFYVYRSGKSEGKPYSYCKDCIKRMNHEAYAPIEKQADNNLEGLKWCNGCHSYVDLNGFYLHKSGKSKGKPVSYCKECMKKKKKKSYVPKDKAPYEDPYEDENLYTRADLKFEPKPVTITVKDNENKGPVFKSTNQAIQELRESLNGNTDVCEYCHMETDLNKFAVYKQGPNKGQRRPICISCDEYKARHRHRGADKRKI